MYRNCLFLLIGVCMLLQLGCSDGRTRVYGTIRYQDKPVEFGKIAFISPELKGPTAEAVVRGGQYEVLVPQGRHTIRLYNFVETGRRYPFGKDKEPAIDYKQTFPPEVNDKSTIVLDIPKGKMEYNYP